MDDPKSKVVYDAEGESGIKRHSILKRFKRDRHKHIKVAVFRYAYYAPLFKFFAEQVLDCEYLGLPAPTKRTLEAGIINSADDVCAPFKHMMGDWIEALERGADVLVQVGGPCRLGFYGEMQERILRDMGYDFTMLNFSHGIEQGYYGWAKEVLKTVNPDIAIPQGVTKLLVCGYMLGKLDEARDVYMESAGFDVDRTQSRNIWEKFLDEMSSVTDRAGIDKVFNSFMSDMRAVKRNKPTDPIKIGIVGELYTAIDSHSNLDLDEKLMDMHVEVHRSLNFANRYLHYNEPNLRRGIAEYARFDMGPTSTLTLAAAKRYAQEGFDGIIHAKCAGCTPEIDCMPVLSRISEDFKIPILYLTYDTETSDTGLLTRLEAFYDMLAMKKERIGR